MAQSFLMAMKEQFQKPGQPLNEFAAEIKGLSYEDKLWYQQRLNKELGLDIAEPVK